MSTPNQIQRFLTIAQHGRHRGASSGEKTAHQVAQALFKLGDDLAVLDSDTVEGICGMIHCLAGPWPTDGDKEFVMRNIRRAATGRG